MKRGRVYRLDTQHRPSSAEACACRVTKGGGRRRPAQRRLQTEGVAETMRENPMNLSSSPSVTVDLFILSLRCFGWKKRSVSASKSERATAKAGPSERDVLNGPTVDSEHQSMKHEGSLRL